MNSVHSWNIKYALLPWSLMSLISSDGHYIGLRVECETKSFNVLDRNFPFPPRNTPRNRSQGEELDTVIAAQSMHAAHSNSVLDLVGVMDGHGPLLYRVKSFPTPKVLREGLATISDRYLNPRVAL